MLNVQNLISVVMCLRLSGFLYADNPIVITLSDDMVTNGVCFSCLSQNVTDHTECMSSSPSDITKLSKLICTTDPAQKTSNPNLCYTRSRPINSTDAFFERGCTDANKFIPYLDYGVSLTSGCRIVKDLSSDTNPDSPMVFCVCGTRLCNIEPPQDLNIYQNPYAAGVDAKTVVNIQPSQTQMAQVAVQVQAAAQTILSNQGVGNTIATSTKGPMPFPNSSNVSNNSVNFTSTATGGGSLPVRSAAYLRLKVTVSMSLFFFL